MILQSLAGLPAFLLYFCTGLIAVVLYLLVYTRVTPHDEFKLICDNDPAAAIALGLSLIGFVIPVVSAIMHTANVIDCLIWSVIALIVQIAVYYIVKIPVPNLSARIAGVSGSRKAAGLSSPTAGGAAIRRSTAASTSASAVRVRRSCSNTMPTRPHRCSRPRCFNGPGSNRRWSARSFPREPISSTPSMTS
jgi:putative membrane protein